MLPAYRHIENRNEKPLGTSPYVAWLQREAIPLFWAGGIPWRTYHRALIPAALKPGPVNLKPSEANALLRESGASLIRWFSKTLQKPTNNWYVICDSYDFERLSRKVRNQIRKATRECVVETVDAEWIAANAYDCYVSAFNRYKHGKAASRAEFEESQRSCIGGPFSFFGAFVDGRLAGFAKCVIEDNYVALLTFKLHPAFNKSLPSYALLHTLLQKYVAESGKVFGNGFLSRHHETNMQDFLLKFGFGRVYCDLQIAYSKPLRLAINLSYPFRRIIARLPSRPPITSVKSILMQEQIRRSCCEQQLQPKILDDGFALSSGKTR